VRRYLGLSHWNTGPGLLDTISFYRCHNGPAMQYGNDSAETTVVKVGQSQVIRLTIADYR